MQAILTQKKNEVVIQRTISSSFNPSQVKEYFSYGKKLQGQQLSQEYVSLLQDRLFQLVSTVTGPSELAKYLKYYLESDSPVQKEEYLTAIAERLTDFQEIYNTKPEFGKTLLSGLTFVEGIDKHEAVRQLIQGLQNQLAASRKQLEDIKNAKQQQPAALAISEEQQSLERKILQLSSTLNFVEKNKPFFVASNSPMTNAEVSEKVQNAFNQQKSIVSFGETNPILESIVIDQANDLFDIQVRSELLALTSVKQEKRISEIANQLIYQEIARLSRLTDEHIVANQGAYQIQFNELSNMQSFIALDLSEIASQRVQQIQAMLQQQWQPLSVNLKNAPIVTMEEYEKLPLNQKKIALIVTTFDTQKSKIPQGIKANSVYVIAKGIDWLTNQSSSSKELERDLSRLQQLLSQTNFYTYLGSMYPFSSSFKGDVLFELEDYYQPILKATREKFYVKGTKRFAILEFSNLEQRILAENRIADHIQEDLLKWKDEYQAAQVNPNLQARFDVPKPTKSPLLSNLAISFEKYFRGNDRKVIHWGLDLSGGKTVEIELRDQNGKPVRNEADIKQGINELYSRVNKMGVSEVSIRREGSNITLDFPGAQGLSAEELVKSSSMFFHIVNEEYSQNNPTTAAAVNQFLQDVWNEAVVTNQKDAESVNRIAWKHLYGDEESLALAQPSSSAAKTLLSSGLRLANPDQDYASDAFDTSLSKIAIYRGDNFKEWHGQTHPLLVVFNNYTLEGSSLTNIRASYDPRKGNFLSFEVKSSNAKHNQIVKPRDALRTWTSQFSPKGLVGTTKADYSAGKGWRMAVILNGSVINAPDLQDTLESSAMISGNFSLREVNKLEADLKAGSLTFSPVILSEKNVSPELGIKDRMHGIFATILALAFVIVLMLAYYRFAGLVASVAVVINLFMIWAALQNVQATLTLAGIAAVILTLGMAVDANVLVFERIREEYAQTGSLPQAVRKGYSKAFTAILDSNVTTVIAALILFNFDSGPIKGFALTLIIGIVSSMFTALFLTRVFFMKYIENPKHQRLSMAKWINKPQIPFLRYAPGFIVSSILIIAFGFSVLIANKNSVLGMDFTGGISTNIELIATPNHEMTPREQVTQALKKAGLKDGDFEIRELSKPTDLRVLMRLPSHKERNITLQAKDQIGFLKEALKRDHLKLTEASNQGLSKNWTVVSGQMSDAMRNQAMMGLGLALLCIMVYISIRFEYRFAFAATLGLIFDTAFSVGMLAILNLLGLPIQLDLKTIAALLTIIGYSLNDTIIIFDRVREEQKLETEKSLKNLLHSAMNGTLSRTVLTSLTTLVVLVALTLFGGSSIFGLSLVMLIGVLYGTFSSLFVSTPLLYYFSPRNNQRKYKEITAKQD